MPYADPQKAKENKRRYYRENKHLWKNADGSWKKQIKGERHLAAARKYTYKKLGRTDLTIDEILDNLFGICPICEQEKKLVYDHDHSTERFRDWICNECNLLLGYAEDNSKVLKKAIKYLEAHNGRS